MKEHITDKGLEIVLAQNNRDNDFDWSEKRFMPKSIRSTLDKNLLQFGDVIVTRSGANYGQTSVITIETMQNDLFACADLLIIKPGNLDGCLLATFLNTKIGKNLMQRGVYGAGQPHVAPGYVKEIPIPEYLLSYSSNIQEIILKYRVLKEKSHCLYIEAQKIIEQELGLNKLNFENPVGYETSFNEVIGAARMDAQCYKPDYVTYEKYLKQNSNYTFLKDLTSSVVKGKQMTAVSNGQVPYVSIKDIDGVELVADSYCCPTKETQIAKKGDLLLAITGATIGKIGIVNQYEKLAFSGDLLRLETYNDINPYYLLTVMQSQIGQSQCNRWTTGSTNGHLAPKDVGKIVIPRIGKKKEDQIAEKIADSLRLKKGSKQLLEKAKQMVEDLIEQAAGVT